MRKLLLFCLPVVLLISAAFTSSVSIRKKQNQFARENFLGMNDFLIADSTFSRMEAYYRNCRNCPNPQKPGFTRNPEVRAYLAQNYDILKEEKRMGRYENDKDVERYKRARNFQDNDERGKVKGRATILYRYTVIPKSNKNGFMFYQRSEFVYSDETTICPPPNGPGCY